MKAPTTNADTANAIGKKYLFAKTGYLPVILLLNTLQCGQLTRISHQEIWLWARRPENGGGNVPEYVEQAIFGDNAAHGQISQHLTGCF